MIDPLEVFPAICLLVAILGVAIGAISWCFGYCRAEKVEATRYAVERETTLELFEKEKAAAILAAFADGKAQGIREATPKHDPKTGQFVPKAS